MKVQVLNDIKAIEYWLHEHKIFNYHIHENLVVNVSQDVKIITTINKLPVKFGDVRGYFDASFNQLTSLRGFPRTVSGNFSVYMNKLTSLMGAPSHIGGRCDISYNHIKSFKHCPQTIGGDFASTHNPINTLDYLPSSIKRDFYILRTKLKNLEIHKILQMDFKGKLFASRSDLTLFSGFENFYKDDYLELSFKEMLVFKQKHDLECELLDKPPGNIQKI